MTSSGDGGSTCAKEDGVGADLDLVPFLDMVDGFDESDEPLATCLDPVQVAGIYGTRFSSTVRLIYVSGTHLEFAFGMDRHSTKFACLSQFAQTPDRSLG